MPNKTFHQYVIGIGLLLVLWIVADNAYSTHIKNLYLNCIFNESPAESKLGNAVYDAPHYSSIRENCALSLGHEWYEMGNDIGMNWDDSAVWQRAMTLPSHLADYASYTWWTMTQ
jgi:hypothetical protein